MWVVNNRKIFYAISGLLVLSSIVSLFVWGLNPGIDFTGGTLIDVSYASARPSQSAVSSAISGIDPSASVRPSGDKDFIIRMKPLSQEDHLALIKSLSENNSQPI